MAEHPLLPHRQLRELHELMLRARKLCRRHDRKGAPPREALLAAAMIHRMSGDLISGEPNDLALQSLASGEDRDAKTNPSPGIPALRSASRLSLCAAAAHGLQSSKSEGIAAVFTTAGASASGWSEVLAWAVRDKLPLLLICTDDLSRPARASVTARQTVNAERALNWVEMTKAAKQSRFPVFSLDGEDAVAAFRVVQETALRARSGDGPSVLWAAFGSGTGAKPHEPVARLRRYMAARGIPLTG